VPDADEVCFDGFGDVQRGIRLDENFRREFLNLEFTGGRGYGEGRYEQKQKRVALEAFPLF